MSPVVYINAPPGGLYLAIAPLHLLCSMDSFLLLKLFPLPQQPGFERQLILLLSVLVLFVLLLLGLLKQRPVSVIRRQPKKSKQSLFVYWIPITAVKTILPGVQGFTFQISNLI